MKNNKLQELKSAIILRAVRDCRSALIRLEKNHLNDKAKWQKEDCEDFFKSDWFKVLSNLDGEMLMRRINEEVEELN